MGVTFKWYLPRSNHELVMCVIRNGVLHGEARGAFAKTWFLSIIVSTSSRKMASVAASKHKLTQSSLELLISSFQVSFSPSNTRFLPPASM